MSKFAQPKYGTGSQFKRAGSPKDGDNIIRILPPMFSLEESGKWADYHRVHWGFAGVHPTDPSKTVMRPFACIQDIDRRTGVVRQDCPACDLYDQVYAEFEEIKSRLKAGGITDEALEKNEEFSKRDMWLKAHRAEGKYYVNVKYADGTFGEFKLNSKWHMSRLREITQGVPATKTAPAKPSLLESKGVDPIAADGGVWFVIRRKDNGKVPDTFDILQEDVEVDIGGKKETLQRMALAPLTDEDYDKALKECKDLTTLGGLRVTYDQIKALVNGSGDPEEVDRILGIGQGQNPRQAYRPTAAPKTETSADEKAAKSETLVSQASVVSDVTTAKPSIAEAMAKRLADINAKKAAEAARVAQEQAAAEAAALAVITEQGSAEPSNLRSSEPNLEDINNMDEAQLIAYMESQSRRV